jgi:hypothetical protein
MRKATSASCRASPSVFGIHPPIQDEIAQMPIKTLLVNSLKHTDKHPVGEADLSVRRERRVVATAKRIEEIIAAGQRRGLSVAKVVQLPDGTCEVHFGTADTLKKRNPYEWDI